MAKLKLIADAKAKSIETEDYATAKAIKSIELEIKDLATKLAEIDLSKKNAVSSEDYDLARELKEKGDLLRNEISGKVMALKIPGAVNSIPPNANVRPLSASARAPAVSADIKNYSGYPSAESKGYAGMHDEKPVGGSVRRGDYEMSINAHDDLPVGRGARRYSNAQDGPENGNELDEMDEYGADGFDHESRPNSKLNRSRQQNEPTVDRMHRDTDPVAIQDDAYGGGEEETADVASGYGNKKSAQQFPPGEHPLEGVQGLDLTNIPDPDPFSIKAKYVNSIS